MVLFIILRQPVTILVTVFSNLTKIGELSTVKQVFFLYQWWVACGSQSLQALHFSGTPILMTGASPLAVYSSTTDFIFIYSFYQEVLILHTPFSYSVNIRL